MDAVLAPRLRLALSRRALRVADDERLVAEVRAGSRSAFEAVFDRHHAGILAFCRHMLGSREEAEDVVQHTFAAAYQALLADDREIALKAWLYAIARNRCLSVLRARREHVALEDAEASIPSTAGLSAEVEQREDLRALLADLQLLPDDQRAALVLAELGAHSHEEIADILGVPNVKIKALVFQAREALMNRHHARDADCGAIREQLAVLRGGALRRGELRHHVAQCEGCRAFGAEVRRQRAGMAVLLPVVPTFALKQSSLAAAFTAGGGGAGAAGGGAAGGGAAGVATAGSVAAGGAAVGGTAVGGSAAGGVAAGGSAVAGTAAAGTAVVGGAAGVGGSSLLTGGALLGLKVVGTKAAIALTLSGVAGGGYVAIKELPSSPPPAAPAHVAPPRSDVPLKPGFKLPGGGAIVPSSVDECQKQRATTPGACPARTGTTADPRPTGATAPSDKCVNEPAGSPSGCPDNAPADPASADPATSAGPTAKDRDGDGIANGPDQCPNKPAPGTTTGCPEPTATTTALPGATPEDRDGDGIANGPDQCPNKPAPDTTTGCPEPTATALPGATPEDRDGDGLLNGPDECPNKPADTPSGCPDRDNDGVPNKRDDCPSQPAPGTLNGCPEPVATPDPVATDPTVTSTTP